MAIAFPFSKASQIASLTEEERKELERARGAAKEPIDFNLSGAYEYLRDKGLDEPQAVRAIAEKLSEKEKLLHLRPLLVLLRSRPAGHSPN